MKLILSWLYGFAVWVRNILYDEHVLCCKKCGIPTICVGNLAVGGTGKTPHTEYLVVQLSKKYKVAILSRGYKRKTKGFVLADEQSTALTIGDEPMQMHLKLPDIPLAVCENRVLGVMRLQELFPNLQVIILDDAFQHRRIQCGFSILLTAENNIYVKDHFIPYGRLRDSRRSSLRADMVVVTKCREQMTPVDRRVIETSLRLPAYQQLFFSYLKYGQLHNMAQVDTLVVGHKPLIMTAIANPEPMIEHLKVLYNDVSVISFADHHHLTQTDIVRLKKIYETEGCDFIITTEKDAARLTANPRYDQWREKTWILPVEVDFKNYADQFLNPIERFISENIRKHQKVNKSQ